MWIQGRAVSGMGVAATRAGQAKGRERRGTGDRRLTP